LDDNLIKGFTHLLKERRVQLLRFDQLGRRVSGVLAAALLASACGVGGSNNAPTAGGDVKLGAIVGLSGIFGAYGPFFQAGMQLAADKVNADGGVVVGNKKLTLKMIFKDDRSDAQVAIADAIEIIRDQHINVIFGPLASEAIAATPVLAQQKVINVSLATEAPDLVGPKYPLLFAILPSTNYRIGAMVAGIQHFYPNTKHVAYVTSNISDRISAPLATQLEVAGIHIDNYTFPPGTTDISTVATKVVAAKPDLIVVGGNLTEEQNVVNQLTGAGLPKSVPCVCYAAQLPNSFGRPQMFPSAYSPVDPGFQSSPEIDAFKSAFLKQLNATTAQPFQVGLGLAYYSAIQLVAKAMQQANTTTDVNAISKAMTEVSLTGFGAKFQWNAGHTITVPLAMTSVSASGVATVAQIAP
jgi:ABC-type branched-subunit amino acid transport system substrate-binding protein